MATPQEKPSITRTGEEAGSNSARNITANGGSSIVIVQNAPSPKTPAWAKIILPLLLIIGGIAASIWLLRANETEPVSLSVQVLLENGEPAEEGRFVTLTCGGQRYTEKTDIQGVIRFYSKAPCIPFFLNERCESSQSTQLGYVCKYHR